MRNEIKQLIKGKCWEIPLTQGTMNTHRQTKVEWWMSGVGGGKEGIITDWNGVSALQDRAL